MDTINFETAFKYAYKNANAWNFLWILVPIYGWFLLMGYLVRIVKLQSEGKYDGLPGIVHGSDFVLGLVMMLKSIPFMIVLWLTNFVLALIPIIGWLANLFINWFIVPILYINFFNKQSIESLFEFKIVHAVFNNFADYIIAALKQIGLTLVFAIGSIVLVGLPGLLFTQNIMLANFYGKYVAGPAPSVAAKPVVAKTATKKTTKKSTKKSAKKK